MEQAMNATRSRKLHVHKLGALAGSLIASSALVGASALAWAPGASAATPAPGSYGGSSAGQSFYLAVAGQQLAAGVSTAKIDSNNNASAEGTGSIIVTQKFGDQTASVSADNTSKSLPDACAFPALPAQLSFIQLNLSCGGANAAVNQGLATANSDGYVSDNSTVSLASLLANIPGAAPAVGSTLTQLGTALSPILSQLPGGLGTTLTTLLNRLPVTTTVGIDIGKSTSSEITTATTVTSQATTTGVQIRILPVATLPPLATITVAPATATATLDRTTGKATGATTAAIVRVEVPTLSVDQTISTPSAPPIAIPGVLSVSLENSNVTTNSDGSVTATAGAVDVEVLPGASGGIPGSVPGGISNSASLLSLKLAQVTASVGGAALAGPITQTQNAGGITSNPSPAVPSGTLPFTGEQPWIPLAGASMLGMSAIGLAVRRFGVKPWRS